MRVNFTAEQEQTVEQAMKKFIPVYEKAMGRKITSDELDSAYWACAGCFMPGRNGKEELDSLLKASIAHWQNYRPKKYTWKGYSDYGEIR